jgi:hypothetical protein
MGGTTARQVTFLSVTTDQLIAAQHPIRRLTLTRLAKREVQGRTQAALFAVREEL